MPDRAFVAPREAIDEACSYLAAGLPFHAHEVLEQRWRCCPDHERELWRALAQAAAALTHAARGNDIGAHRLHERAVMTVSGYDGPVPDGIVALTDALSLPFP